jgi:RsiW-degrading membrane proteinase PrsW (M82 family)
LTSNTIDIRGFSLNILAVFLLAFAPCVFWLWLIYKGDRYRPEPKSLIIRIFFLGLVVSIPVAFIEVLLYPNASQAPASLPSAAYLAFVVAGFTEEAGKFLVVRWAIYRSPYFEEPLDGIEYSAAAALGFASLENVAYLISFGLEVILVRGYFKPGTRRCVLWGYPMALGKLGIIRKGWVWLGLLAAIVAHGLFDFLFFIESGYTFFVIPLFIGMVVIFILMLRHANRISPYRITKP